MEPISESRAHRLDLTVEFLKVEVEFRFEDNGSAGPTITGIDRVDGLDWMEFRAAASPNEKLTLLGPPSLTEV